MTPGAYILAPAADRLTDREWAFFREADPWGFILFQRNCVTPAQLVRLTSDLRDCVGREAPILIDQEGGRVQRMRAPHWREYLSPLEQVQRAGPGAERAMYLRGLMIGAELAEMGIDVNCAPTCDIARPETHRFLHNRCYGTDAASVIANARAVAEGQLAAGVLSVVKHAPGHGRARSDSHYALPTIEAPLSELSRTDFRPFKALSDLPMAMTAHLILPEVDAETPITQSAAGIRLIRETLGLTGLLMTDDISMEALDGDVAHRGVRAVDAGCDVVLHCNGELEEMLSLAEAVGRMTPVAAARADAALTHRRSPAAVDMRAVLAELEGLQTGVNHA